MKARRYKEDKRIINDLSSLYLTAFPEDERPPLKWLVKHLDNHKENDIISFYDNDAFIGFSYITLYEEYCYIFFLAVEEKYRNQGYGSKILSYLKELYQDEYTLYLSFEEIDDKYKDNELRKRRANFYHRNGFIDNPLKINEYGVTYQTARVGSKKITYEIHKKIFTLNCGEYSLKYIEKI